MLLGGLHSHLRVGKCDRHSDMVQSICPSCSESLALTSSHHHHRNVHCSITKTRSNGRAVPILSGACLLVVDQNHSSSP